MKLDGVRLKIAVGLAAYLVGLGALGGVLMERWRFDHRRAQVLRRYNDAVRGWKAQQMAIETGAISVDSPSAPLARPSR
jgi:hypothetical protein